MENKSFQEMIFDFEIGNHHHYNEYACAVKNKDKSVFIANIHKNVNRILSHHVVTKPHSMPTGCVSIFKRARVLKWF